jgi:hypothetical protein
MRRAGFLISYVTLCRVFFGRRFVLDTSDSTTMSRRDDDGEVPTVYVRSLHPKTSYVFVSPFSLISILVSSVA